MTSYLPYTPPYDWTGMLRFLAARAVPATEQIVGATYRRTLQVPVGERPACDAGDDPARSGGGRGTGTGPPAAAFRSGVVTVADDPQRRALRVELSSGLAGSERLALSRIGQLFDLGCDPEAVGAALAELAGYDRGLRLPGAANPFEIVVRAILGQQVTVAAARTIATRFVACFGPELPRQAGGDGGVRDLPAHALPHHPLPHHPLPHHPLPDHPLPDHPLPDHPLPTHLFPTPATIAALVPARLGEIGIIRARGAAIIAAAEALATGHLRLEPGAAVEPTLSALTAVRGIGPWTAHYVAMRTLGWTDAFPPGDVVVLRTLNVTTPAAAADWARRWRPWRSYALLHLWRRAALSATSR